MAPPAPPHALEAERSVLGAVILKPACMPEVVSLLEEDDFYLPVHRVIWRGMVELDRRRVPIDLVTLPNLLGEAALASVGGDAYLVTMAGEVPTAENVSHYAGIVRDKSARRRLMTLCAETAARAQGDDELPEILGSSLRDMMRVGMGVSTRPEAIGSAVTRMTENLEARIAAESEYGFPVSLRVLDGVLGRLQPENLTLVAARPGMGKSALLGNILLRGAQLGYPCLLFQLEMSDQEFLERQVSALTGIPVQRLHVVSSTHRLTPVEWKAVSLAASKLAKLPLKIQARPMRLGEIVAQTRSWLADLVSALPKGATLPPVAVAVDYIQRVRPDARQKGRNRAEEVAEISGTLKDLAKELKIPIMAAAQLNRDAAKEERRPVLEDLKESGALEQDADQVLMIHRDRRAPPKGLGEDGAELLLRKNRHGGTGIRAVRFHGPTNVFSDPLADEPDRQADLAGVG